MGYSETLETRATLTPNLGDVLRTTFILNYFKNERITWLSDSSAYPLLEGNKYIDEIVMYSAKDVEYLKSMVFDLIVNLEKIPEVCLLLKDLKYKKLLGFNFGGNNKALDSYSSYLSGHKKLVEVSSDYHNKRNNKVCFQEILVGAIGENWQEEPYILGYSPKSKPVYDIGFNWTTSNKWKNKAWPRKHWKELEGLLSSKYKISWQKGFSNLYEYMEWINSCRSIITADTLGLHIALALKKRLVVLFGPTSPQEIFLYNLGSLLTPEVSLSCIPCCLPYCQRNDPCIKKISPMRVKKQIEYEIKQIECPC